MANKVINLMGWDQLPKDNAKPPDSADQTTAT